MVGTISRRECLKLVLAANAAWLGSAFAGPLVAELSVPRLSSYDIPIEGLGLGIRATNLLRRGLQIPTVGKLLDVLGGREEELRSYRRQHPPYSVVFTEGVQRHIRTRLAVLAEWGPVQFATQTRLECRALDLVRSGRSTKEIAAWLNLREEVARWQLRSIHRKMYGLCAPCSACQLGGHHGWPPVAGARDN